MPNHYIHAHPTLQALIQVSRAAEYVNHQMNIVLSELDITNVQYNILRIVKSNKEVEGISRVDIKRQLIEQSIDLTRSIAGLIKLGYITRVRPDNDRRLMLHSITEAGTNALAQIDPILHRILAKMEQKMTDDEWALLNSLCVKMMQE